MNKAEDDVRAKYRREDLGKGVRGKYFARYAKGSNLVLLDPRRQSLPHFRSCQ